MICDEIEKALSFIQQMLQTKGYYQAYIASLPRVGDSMDEVTTPDFWKIPEIDEIPVPRLRQSTWLRKHMVQEMSTSVADMVSSQIFGDQTPAALLQWATWVIRTRGFSTFRIIDTNEHSDGEGKSSHLRKRCFLLPLVDFVNHADVNQANVELEVFETPDDEADECSMFALRATRDIAAGEELTMTYGTGLETSLDLLDKYGFWLDEPGNHAGDSFVHSNNDLLDWSLVDQEWKQKVSQGKMAFDPDSHLLSRAQKFNRHLASLYLETIESNT